MVLILLLVVGSFFQSILADQALGKSAERVLNSVAYTLPSPSIIGKREWKELQLDRLVTILDRTTTSFGRWGLVTLLQPIADHKQLQKRKEIITFLVDHPENMRSFQKQLKQVARVEKSLLAYWDGADQLSRNTERFYFSALGLDPLNKSSLALDASTVLEGFNIIKSLAQVFALWGVSQEFLYWSVGAQQDFNLLRGIRTGLMDPLLRHSPWLYKLDKGPYTWRNAAQAVSWGDVYNVWKSGISEKSPDGTLITSPPMGKIGGFFMATASTLLYDYQWANAIDSIGKRIIGMNRDLNQLQVRVSDVAQCIKSIMQLRESIASQDDAFNHYWNDGTDDEILEVFLKKLFNPRFLQKQKYLYSRGHVLTMHQEIKRMKRSLISLLHSVALLDAYCSIAQLYTESQDKPVMFSFPEFVESPQPFVQYHKAWLPLLSYEQAIANDLVLGADQPGKFVITGPNGGGKSTVLKTYGVAAVLAQSWGIVPAQSAQQTIFSSIKTALALQPEKDLSDFMTEAKTMTGLFNDIAMSDEAHPVLVLIDEPYKTTVNVESAKRIYQFGKNIAGFNYALVGVATHLKKPIELERDTSGIFANYQVKIREISFGVFERLFTIEKGPATWWFEDEAQRSRFIDWISTKTVDAH